LLRKSHDPLNRFQNFFLILFCNVTECSYVHYDHRLRSIFDHQKSLRKLYLNNWFFRLFIQELLVCLTTENDAYIKLTSWCWKMLEEVFPSVGTPKITILWQCAQFAVIAQNEPVGILYIYMAWPHTTTISIQTSPN